MARGKSGRTFIRILILLAVGAAVVAGVGAFRVGPEPSVTIEPALPGIGKRTPVRIAVAEPQRGLAGYRVEIAQGESVQRLDEREFEPREGWRFWGPRTESDEMTVEVGKETVDGLKEGPATIRVVAERAGAWLRSPDPKVETLELQVKLRPPTLQVVSTHVYVDQGGCEVVVYRVGETSVRDGVRAGDWFFPGFPLPGDDAQQRFAMFGVPFDMSDVAEVRLVAEDDVGNAARAAFVDRFKPKPFRSDTIGLNQAFMEKVVPAILSQTTDLDDKGDLLENYLMINGELRRRNAETLIELAGSSQAEFLWREAFLPMRNAAVMSNFADRRTYVFEGRAVDRQDHLGFDLASTAMAPIQAANDGVVVLARFFGIYGNAVVIDHGFGLMSLYGHLSSIAVEEGQVVERGREIGRSGATGLAAGDHLHFTMLLHGLAVNPREWWDSHWIHDRLKLKLGPALPFEN